MSDRTKVTEVATALGVIPSFDPQRSLPVPPPELYGVDDQTWELVHAAFATESHAEIAGHAFENGRAFLGAIDGLRGRAPRRVEWHGPHGSPGDEVAPIDLRIDHVYLVSCKYLSKIVTNASPSHVFDRLLLGRHGVRADNWYDVVAPDEHLALFESVKALIPAVTRASHPSSLSVAQRRVMKRELEDGWPRDAAERYRELVAAVSSGSSQRWNAALPNRASREAMLWRLLRIGSAPYFVLGTTNAGAMRLRVGSPWDWRQSFTFRGLEIRALDGGQPMVAWQAEYRSVDGEDHLVAGHVEVRWSHGRFSGPPEAKVYLDTPHHLVPGYWPLV